jgi:hypothetical protein
MDESWLAREFHRISLFSDDELLDIENRILKLRDIWIRRSERGFFTLGINCYMDLANSKDANASYFDRAENNNEMLSGHFADVYIRLGEVLNESLQTRTLFEKRLAMPGFHVWLSGSIPRNKTASVHFDLQYLPIVEPGRQAGPVETMSFTIPIRLPGAGGGLNVWPLRWPEDRAQAKGALATPCERMEYRPGEMVLHNGLWLHQIGEVSDVTPDDIRITLQGHAVRMDDRTILYW